MRIIYALIAVVTAVTAVGYVGLPLLLNHFVHMEAKNVVSRLNLPAWAKTVAMVVLEPVSTILQALGVPKTVAQHPVSLSLGAVGVPLGCLFAALFVGTRMFSSQQPAGRLRKPIQSPAAQ